MTIDIKSHRKELDDDEPEIKLVPFIDILFTLLIFLVVTSSFGSAAIDDAGSSSGKPNMTDTTGDAEYYLLPVAHLEKVIVNGQDFSSEIQNNAIGVHANVLDQGEIQIKTQEHTIIITTPAGMNPKDAVCAPNSK